MKTITRNTKQFSLEKLQIIFTNEIFGEYFFKYISDANLDPRYKIDWKLFSFVEITTGHIINSLLLKHNAVPVIDKQQLTHKALIEANKWLIYERKEQLELMLDWVKPFLDTFYKEYLLERIFVKEFRIIFLHTKCLYDYLVNEINGEHNSREIILAFLNVYSKNNIYEKCYLQ